MSRQKALRAGRIVDLRAMAVDRIEVELAACVRRTSEVAESIRMTREAWQVAALQPQVAICSSADMANAHDHRVGLTRRIETLVVEHGKALSDEDACRARLRAAKSDAKKIEMWRDRLLDAAGAEEMMHERKTTDEVAARIVRTQ
jgi:flagellar export protein FliJ